MYIYEKNKGATAFYYHDEREPKSLVDNQQVNWIREDSDHSLWIGAEDTVIYNLKDKKIERINETTRCMLQDSKKRFWLATSNRGLALFSKEKGIIR